MERETMLYKMAEEYHKGKTVQEVIFEYLGEDAEKKYTEVQKMVHSVHPYVESMMKRYEGTDLQLAVLTEIDKLYPDDASKQFAALSKLKYQNMLRSIELGSEILEEEGYDTRFLRETALESYKTEQEMAETATWTEVTELEAELMPLLMKNGNGILDTMRENEEEWEPMLEMLDSMENTIQDSLKEDMEAMVAVTLLEEEPKISVEEAVKTALYQIWLGHLQTWKELCLMDLALLEAGAVVELMGVVTGGAILQGVGGMLVGGSLVGFAILAAAALGAGASYAVEKMAPAAEKLQRKVRPWMKQAAEQVKLAVARMIGFMANRVIRPTVRWVKGSGVPAVEEHVYYPLKRRLQAMLAWIGEKAEQVKLFVIHAAAPEEWSEEEAWDAKRYARETGYEPEMETEEAKEPEEPMEPESETDTTAKDMDTEPDGDAESESKMRENAETEPEEESTEDVEDETEENSAEESEEKEKINLSFA